MAIRGKCWVRIEGVDAPIYLSTGDLIVMPRGASHILSDKHDRKPLQLDNVLEGSGYEGHGALVYGGSYKGEACKLFCGYFEFDAGVTHPILSSLPRYIHLPNMQTMNAYWLESAIRFVSAEVTDHLARQVASSPFDFTGEHFVEGDDVFLTPAPPALRHQGHPRQNTEFGQLVTEQPGHHRHRERVANESTADVLLDITSKSGL